MSISEADVRHVAALARLGLDDARMPSLVAELNGILAHMEVLQGVALPDAAVHTEGERAMPLRADTPGARSLGGELAAFAPTLRDGFFLVPRLATHGTAGAQDTAGPGDEEHAS